MGEKDRPCSEACALNNLEPALARKFGLEIIKLKGGGYYELAVADGVAVAASVMARDPESKLVLNEATWVAECLLKCPLLRE